jgi:outer membrane autotransporter protein
MAGQTVGGYIEGGYRMATPSVDIIPLASLKGIHLTRDGFTERGAGALCLDAGSDTVSSLVSSLGVRLTKDYRVSSGTLSPEVRVTWDDELMNGDYALDASFAGYPTSTFTVEGDRPERDSLGTRFSLTFQAKENLHFHFAYDGSFSGDNTQHAGMAGLRYRW